MSNEPDNFKNKWRNKRNFTNDEAREFWGDAQAEARRGECDFEGVYFPEDPNGKGFSEIEFQVDADFSDAEFGGDANFRDAKFGGVANFIYAKFGGKATFWKAKFGGDVYFEKAHFGDANFGRDANFHDAKFSGKAIFYNTIFWGNARFFLAEFCAPASFRDAEFKGEVDFSWVQFERGSFVIDLPRGWRKSTRRPFARLGQGYDAYRIAKQAAANLGDYSQAGKYHYAEGSIRCWDKLISGWRLLWRLDKPSKVGNKETPKTGIKDKLLRLFRKGTWISLWNRLCGAGRFLWAVGELVFGRLLFGYGERIRGIVIATVLVIFGWTCGYSRFGIELVGKAASNEITHNFLECLYFSVVTFTTLGYGDMKPVGGMRALAASEALAGAFLMALFVVAMARKFTR